MLKNCDPPDKVSTDTLVNALHNDLTSNDLGVGAAT